MVLLTSSTVSAVISITVVCVFTFLLFLSGYVLQQQTVKSLQEALRQPPEPKPTPTLPAKFQQQNNATELDEAASDEQVIFVPVGAEQEQEAAPIDGSQELEDPVQGLDQEQGPKVQAEPTLRPITQKPHSASDDLQSQERLAYILSLPEPVDLCSAVLFAKWQRQSAELASSPTIMILYPTTWETSASPLHLAALTFMRDMQSEYSLTYHPVQFSSVWSGVGINSHLLGEFQRIRWDFDQALYLKSPGMALDTTALDRLLASSDLKRSWAPLSAAAGQDPDMLLYSRKKGLMMGRGDTRRLVASAMTSHQDHHAGEMDVEVATRKAAYVVFNEEELEHRRNEREWYGGIFERFEREREQICKDRGLLHGDEDRPDLKRKL
jgi:hypothetical protein